jgi:predicted SPOUT superfamily RNA methylase MTH1
LEEYIVRNLNRYISSLVLASALAAPVVIMAAPAPQEASVQVRVYDRNHKDYHNWDDREDRAYRGYLTEQHRNYREYNKQSGKQQRNYWAWRHSHPDRD